MLLTSSNPTQHLVPWCPACDAFSAKRLHPRLRVRPTAQQQRSDAGTGAQASTEQAVSLGERVHHAGASHAPPFKYSWLNSSNGVG